MLGEIGKQGKLTDALQAQDRRGRCRRPSSKISTCRTSPSGARGPRSPASAGSSRWPSRSWRRRRSPSRARRWRRRSSAAKVPDVEAAWAGARDIVAERVAERADVRAALREQALDGGMVVGTAIAGKEEEGAKFKDYFNFHEPAKAIPSHRLLALRRGETEGFLRVALEVDARGGDGPGAPPGDRGAARRRWRASSTLAVADAYERLLQDVDRGRRAAGAQGARRRRGDQGVRRATCASCCCRRRSAASACWPSIPASAPAARSRWSTRRATCRRTTSSIPTQSERKVDEAAATLERLCKKYRIEAIAIGNGTAGRETETFVRKLAADGKLGAASRSSWSTRRARRSTRRREVAREELPDQDVTVRGAVSIGRRLAGSAGRAGEDRSQVDRRRPVPARRAPARR